MIIKLEADSYDPLDLSFILKEGNKPHNFKLYGASVISATEVVTGNDNWPPYMARPHRQEITFNCDYFEILNDNDDINKEEKLKEQQNDNDEEIVW